MITAAILITAEPDCAVAPLLLGIAFIVEHEEPAAVADLQGLGLAQEPARDLALASTRIDIATASLIVMTTLPPVSSRRKRKPPLRLLQ